jgi:hypothetical protein
MLTLATAAGLLVLAQASPVSEPASCVMAYGVMDRLQANSLGVALPANFAGIDFAARQAAAAALMSEQGATPEAVEKARYRGKAIFGAADLSVMFGNPPPDLEPELAWARLCDQQFGFSPVLDPRP